MARYGRVEGCYSNSQQSKWSNAPLTRSKESLFNVWSLQFTKSSWCKKIKCAKQQMDILKPAEKLQPCEWSFSDLRMCQIQTRSPEVWKTLICDSFQGSFMEVLNTLVLWLPLDCLWLRSTCTGEKSGPGIRGGIRFHSLVHHRRQAAS